MLIDFFKSLGVHTISVPQKKWYFMFYTTSLEVKIINWTLISMRWVLMSQIIQTAGFR